MVFALLALACASRSRADGDSHTDISAALRLDYFSSSRALDDVANVVGAHFELKLAHDFSPDQQFRFQGRLSREDLTRHGHDNFRFIDTYFLLRGEAIDLRLGQQKVRWGKADGINPTDFFTPIDLTLPLPLEEDQHLSIPAARADYSISDIYTLSLVVEPNFSPSRLPFAVDFPLAIREEQPSGLRQPQVGARLLQSGDTVDWSLSAFRGFSTLPVLSAAGVDANGTPQLLRYYPGIDGLGADIAHNFGRWGFRAELAYTDPHDDAGKQSVSSSYFLVSGVDRSFDDWNVNAQLLLHYTPHQNGFIAEPASLPDLAATENALIYGQTRRFLPGMTTRIASTWLHETLRAEVLAAGYFSPSSYFVRPLITYSLSDTQRIMVGGEYYAGSDLSYFGELKKNRTAYIEFAQFF